MADGDCFWVHDSVLFLILEKIESIYDYARFSLVCKSWFSIARAHYSALIFRSNLQKKQLPLLLIPGDNEDDHRERSGHRALHTVIGWKTLKTQLHIPMKKRCCGSAYGWLIFAEESLAITLYNPFTSATILLPPVKPRIKDEQNSDPSYEILKVVLSADPYVSPDSFEVVALHEFIGSVSYYKHTPDRTNNWILLDRTHIPSQSFYDAIHHRGKFYVVGDHCVASVKVEDNGHATLVEVMRQIAPRNIKIYLVESLNGCLFYIVRFHIPDTPEGYFEINEQHYLYDPDNHRITKSFQVYEFDTTKEEKCLRLVNSIGDEAIFIGGFNDSVSVVASSFSGCQANCIYYADDFWWGNNYDEGSDDEPEEYYQPYGPIDIGFFRVGEDESNPRYMLDQSRAKEPPPIWIIPTLKFHDD